MENHAEETVAGGTWMFLGNLAILLTSFALQLATARHIGAD
jgi:hypothetical protein